MALDFHNNENRNEHLFAVESRQFAALSEIFNEFQYWTGILIDEYGDFILNTANQKTLLKVIDKYIEHADLNKDKEKTIHIIEFRAMINYFYNRNIDILGLGD